MQILSPPPSPPLTFIYQVVQPFNGLSTTHSGAQFYRYGPDNYLPDLINDNIIIFFSDEALSRINSKSIIAVDGTFKCCPPGHKHLYTLSYLENNHVFPVFLWILKDKRLSTYIDMFKIIIRLGYTGSPEIVKCYFEQASITAIRSIFPSITVNACQFHRGQMIARKIRDFGLKRDYEADPIINKYIGVLSALCFVVPEEVGNTFAELLRSPGFPDIIYDLYLYFFNNLIGNEDSPARFPISFWNSYSIRGAPRTNNAIEGWHHSLNASFNNIQTSFPPFN